MILALLLAASAATGDPVADAEDLVRGVYYEGLPYEQARALDDRGVARLADMLSDPAEAPHHGNVVLALGMSGHPRAFEILAAYARREPAGEVDRDTFRARSGLAPAMGHLAQDDPRALRWLLDRARARRGDPGWSFRHQRGTRLATLLEEQQLTGLALSGAPQARRPLEDARERARGGDASALRLRRHADGALALHDRIARDGPRAFRADPARPGQGSR